MQRFALDDADRRHPHSRVLFVDNYDSFSFNVVHALAQLGAVVDVIHHDDPLPRQSDGDWTHLVLSPGPGTPTDSGICQALAAQALAGHPWPLLGICLGHQVICAQAGAQVVRAAHVMHGKTSVLHHDSTDLFVGLPQGFAVMRYHSLVVEPSSLPSTLKVCAWTAAGEVMAVRHLALPIWGVQFHPESIASEHGAAILAAFLAHHAG